MGPTLYDACPDAGHVGLGCRSIRRGRTDAGRMEIHHAAGAAGRYHLGAMLSEIDHPERIVTRRRKPVLEPEVDYELAGVYGNCVFSNGLVVDDDGAMVIYYGAADSICAGAATTVDEIIAAARTEL